MRRRSMGGLVSPGVQALRQIEDWPVPVAAAGVARAGGTIATRGDPDRVALLASVSKPVSALAVLVAAEEGVVDLDEPAGPPGSTVRHLLAHTSGLPFEGSVPIAEPGRRRIYSNTGFEQLAEHVAVTAEMSFGDYMDEAVCRPLGIAPELLGSPAAGLHGTLREMLDLAPELLAPTLVAGETFSEATSVQFPGLAGVLPGFGRWDPNDWGLGFELRDGKSPHWTGTRNSTQTFGHFGGSGAFLWVDPDAGLALGCLTDLPFDDWAKEAWPRLSDAVLDGAG